MMNKKLMKQLPDARKKISWKSNTVNNTKGRKKRGFKVLSNVIIVLLSLILIIYGKFVYTVLRLDNKTSIKDVSSKKQSLYDPSKIMFLNMTDASMMRDHEPNNNNYNVNNNNGGKGEFSIDVITIGSISSIEKVKTQLKSWGSHVSRRHFWLATEFDDPDPNCYTTMTLEEVSQSSSTCGSNGNTYWRKMGALNDYTSYVKNFYAQERWLLAKKNPQGWLCAQKRFLYSLSKLMKLYRESKNKYGVELPDYLIFNDDDTWINLEMFEDQLLRTPLKEVKEKGLSYEEQQLMVWPTPNVPVVFAGCRVRKPTYQIHDTFPFGGYGIMISKGSIERLIQPLYCNDTMTGFEWEACEYFTPAYANWSIGEEQYFKPGMSVSDLMGSYIENVKPFCLHSDWAIGYFINHFNISRHVVPTGHLHPDLSEKAKKVYWYNDNVGDVKHSRLHAWDDSSEWYQRERGNCINGPKKCKQTSGSCHYMDESAMERVYKAVKKLFPEKFRTLKP